MRSLVVKKKSDVNSKRKKKLKWNKELANLASSDNYDRRESGLSSRSEIVRIMKLVSWNVRGMNIDLKRAMLKDVFKSAKGEFLFLQETKMEIMVMLWYDLYVHFGTLVLFLPLFREVRWNSTGVELKVVANGGCAC